MAYIIEVRPAWHLAAGEEDADDWRPALPDATGAFTEAASTKNVLTPPDVATMQDTLRIQGFGADTPNTLHELRARLVI